MVGKNNKRLLREKHANKFKRYALKKLTVGLASVTIGTGLAFATSSTVSADELAVGESTAVVSDKTAKEQSQPDTPYLQEQEEAVPPAEEPQVTEDRISEEKAVKTSEETDEKATESKEVAEEKPADSHDQTEEASDKEETNTKVPQATTTQLAPVVESAAEPVREEQSAEAPTPTLSQIDQLPEEFLTYLRDHSDIVDFKNAATIETYANLLQQSYGVEAAKEERIRAIEAAVKEIETTKEQAKNDVVDQTERLIDVDKDSTTPQDQSKETFKKAIQQADNPQTVVESYLKDAGYKAEDIAGILANVDMSLANDPDQLLDNIVQAGVKYANENRKANLLNVSDRNINQRVKIKAAQIFSGNQITPLDAGEDSYIRFEAQISIEGRVREGDYFEIRYDEILTPDGLDLNSHNEYPPIRSANGDILARPNPNPEEKVVRYTFTPQANNRTINQADIIVKHAINRSTVTRSGQHTVDYYVGDPTREENHFSKEIEVVYPDVMADISHNVAGNINFSYSYEFVRDNGEYRQVFYANPKKSRQNNMSITLFSDGREISRGQGSRPTVSQLNRENSNVRIYEVLDTTKLNPSMMNDYTNSRVFKDVSNQFPNRNTFSNNTTRLGFGNTNKAYVVVVDSKTRKNEQGQLVDNTGKVYTAEEGSAPMVSGARFTYVNDGLGVNAANFISRNTVNAGAVSESSLYEMTVEDIAYPIEYQHDPTVAPGQIVVRENERGQSGRQRILYRHIDPNEVPDFNPDNFVNMRGSYWEEVSRETIQEAKPQIVRYNFVSIVSSTQNDDGGVTITYSNGQEVTIPGPKKPDEPQKPLRPIITKEEAEDGSGTTVKIEMYNPNTDQIESKQEIFIENGKQGEPGTPGRDGDPGKDGRTPSVHTERNEDTGETIITFYYDTNNDGTYTKDQDELIRTEKVKDGKEGEPGAPGRDGNPGEDGRTPSVHTERNEDTGETTITFYYDTNNDGTYTKDQDELIRTEKVKDGKEGEPGAPGRDGNPGEDGRTPSVHTERNEDTGETTITFYYDTNNDGTYTKDQDELIKTEKVKDGKEGEPGAPGRDGNPGEDGRTPSVHTERNEEAGETTITFYYDTNNDGTYTKDQDELIRTEKVKDGKEGEPGAPGRDGNPGEDGRTPSVHTERNEDTGETIITFYYDTNNDGTYTKDQDELIRTEKVKDGKEGEPGAPGRDGNPGEDGRTPSVHTERNEDTGETTITFYYDTNNDGTYTKDQDELIKTEKVKDGKNATGTETVAEAGHEDPENSKSAHGVWVTVYKTDADGNRLKNDDNNDIELSREFIRDGKDGKTPTVETEDIIVDDEIVGTKIIVKDGDGQTVSEREIYDGIDGIDGEDGKDGLSPKVTIEENVTDEEGNPGTRIIITPQYRDENGEIRNGHPEESFIKDGKDGKTPTVETEDIIVDDEIVGTKVIVKDGDGEIVSEREIYDGIDGIDGEDGKDGLSPKVTIEENATDEEGNPGTRIIITPQYRDENGEIRNGHPEESFIKDGKDGKTPTVETEDIIVDDEIVGTKVIVKDGDGEIVSEREIYDGIDGIDGEDGKDGLSPKVTIEENATDEQGNPGTRIIITPQYRDENGEIRNGQPEETFIKDGKDGKTPTVETEDIIVDGEIVGTKVIVKDGDGKIVSEREIYDGIDGIDGEDGKDGLSPKVTIEENVTDEEGNPGTRIIITPQYRDENGEIRNGHPEESFIKDGKDGKTPTVETEDIIVDDEIVGTKVIVKDGDGEIVSEREIYDGIDGIDGEDGKDGLSPKVTIEENVTDEEGNPGTRIIITPQYRDENGEIRNGHPEESFIKDGKDGKTPTVETEDIIVDDEIVGTKVIVKDGDGEIVSEREIYDGIDGIDGEDGKDGLSPKVTIEENVTDEEGNPGTRIIITPQYRDENGEIRNGHPEESFIKDGKDGKTPTVETEDIIVDDEIVGTKVIVKDGDGEIVSEREIYDGIDGIDGEDGKDGLSPKVTIEENVTDEEGNPGTRIIITPQYRDENGEIRNGHPEESFIKDGKDGKTPTVETEDIIVDDEIVGTKVIVKDGDGEIVSEREIYDGIDGIDGEDGKDGLSPKVTIEENVTDEEGNPGTRIIITPQYRDENGEIRNGHPEESFIKDGKDGKTPTVETEDIIVDDEIVGTKVIVKDGDGEIVSEREIYDGIDGIDGEDGKDGLSPKVTIEENVTDEEGNPGTRIIITPQYRDENGEIRNGHPEESFIKDGKDGKTPTVETEDIIVDDEIVGTKVIVKDGDGEIVSEREIYDGIDGIDGEDGKDGLSPKVTIEENVTDEEGNPGTRIIITPQYRDENGEIRNGHPEESFIKDGKDGKTPTVETEDIIVDDEIVGTKVIVKDGDGEIVSEREIYDGIDGIDGEDGKDGLSPKVTIEENVTDEEGNPGTRIIITPQYRDENGEIRNGHPEESFIKDGKDGKTPTVETEDIIVDDEIVGTKVIVKDGDGEIVSEREIYDGIDGIDGEDGKDGLSPKVTIEENVTDEEGNPGTRIIITPQYRDENGEIRNGHPEESFIKDGKDGKTPTVETEDIIVDDEIVGTKVIVKDGDGEIVSEREIYDGIDGIDGEDGKDGLSPKVTIEENATDEEGNPGTRIIITPQYRDENGEIRNGHPEESFIKDGKDGKTPTVETEDIIVDDEIVGTKVIVKDGDGEIVSEREIYDGIDGIDGEDGKDGLSPKVTIEENVTDEEGNPGTRIIITPQYRDENGEIRNGHPEESFIKDGKDGKTPTVETEDIIVDDEIVGTKVIVKDGDGEIVSEREIYDGIDGIDGEDGKDGLSPKVTIEENVTDEEGNPGTRIIITPQYRDENGEIRNGHPEESFIKDGKDGKTPTVETEDIIVDDEIVGTKVIVKDGDGEIVSEREIYDGIDGIDGEDGKDGLSPKVTIEENVTDEEGNPGTRIIITPQYRDENGEIRNGHPEESFIKDGKDGKTPTVETEDIIVDDEIVGTKVIVKDGDGEIVSEREIYDGIDGIDGEDGKDGLSPKVTIEENVTDEEGNPGTRIIITPQYRDENGEIRNGHPEESFIKDGKDGKTPTVETEDIIVDDEIVGTKVIVKDGDGEIVSEREIYDGIDGIDGEDGKDGLSPKVTIEENVTDEEGNPGTRIIITPQYRDENGEIRNGHPEESFIKDGKDGKTPTVETEDIIVDDEIVGTKVIVKDGDGEIVSEREIYDGIDGIDGEDGKDGLSPKVTIEENVTDEEGNPGTRIIITPQYRDENGEIRNGHPEESFIKDGKDGKTPTVETEDIIVDGEIVGTKVIVKDGDGKIVSEREIYDGIDGIDGEDGKDGLSPKVTIEENVTDENGNPGTRIIITPQYRDENGEIRNGQPEETFVKDGEDGKSITVERTETDRDGNTVVYFSDGSKVTIAKGDKGDRGEKGEPGKDGKDGNSVTASVERGEQNGRPGTYVIIRNEDGTEIDREFIFDGENGQTPTIESSNVLDANGQIVGTRIIIRDGDGHVVGDQIIRNGKDGQNGKDGETPTIGSNGNWFIAGKDTGVKAKGEDGQSITITKETRDADGNTIVHFSDGSTVTISKGDKGDQGQKGDKGERGQTPNVSQTPIRDQNGRIVGYTLTFTDPVTGEKIGNSIDVYNGTDGKDGKSVTASVERGEQNGRPGSYIIIRNEDGVELDREFVFDGEDGTTPKVSVQTIERNDGRKTHIVAITNPKTGETQTFTVTDGEKGQPGQAGKDGRDGRDGRDGKDGFTPTIGSNGNWFIAGQDTGVKAKGEDGQSITVTKEVKDEQGNTVVHFSDGSTITISKGDKGEAGPAGKDGRDGRDGKDGKDLTGNNGNINIENSNNQSQDQNQTQNQNINQVVTNNTYNFGDVSLIINQTLNLNGEVVLTKVIVKDKDGLTNETQIDKNTQINQLNVFVNNGQVLVGTFNLTNQNNVKQLLVGNLIINLVINNDSADNPTVPKKPEQPETTPERPSETPDNTPEQPNETPNVPSTPDQPGETPEAPGTNETPDNTPEQSNETPNVPSTPDQPGETPEAPGTNETPDNTPEQPNETPNVPSTPGQPGETPEAPGTSETPDNTPEQPNETPDVPSTPEETPGQPGETPEAPGTNEIPDNTPEQPNETPDVPSTPEETPGQPGETPEAPGPNETPNTPTQLSNTPAQSDRSSITGERLPETATDSWMLALASLVSLSSGAVLAVKKKKDDE
ncbi:YSIRK-type signal peptide-containing protein [Dolosigranulum pigrum]|uniref:Ig-like domain-containing protein n=1 Tax=Dolosigranulum pigrum TaxID=29394 RepID=UPI00155EB906|nr:Ig-like domain-containing protein [Dolosigranulum pigrum]QJS98423.1 YSIRK-type signal peptide-containing protein [Dolosigranulum pigrum]